MKKIYFLIFMLSFGCGFGLMRYIIATAENHAIHVFTEGYATNPAFSQMIQFIQLPKSTEKMIAWHRFMHRGKVINLAEYNTTELDFARGEVIGGRLGHLALKHVLMRHAQDPHKKFVLHGNLGHVESSIYPFLKALPKENILRIHLYEDGYGELFKGSRFHTSQTYEPPLDEKMKLLIETGEGKWESAMNFSLQKMYTVTYHLAHADKINGVRFLQPLAAWIQGAKIENIDFENLRTTLTPEQKELLYKLTGFDYPKYAALMKDKPTIVFIMGYFFGNKQRMQAEQNWLKELTNGPLPPLTDGQKYTWFYKPHPTLSQEDVTDKMSKNFPEVLAIPAQVPFEILIVAGLKPTYTVGFSSSLFYSLKSSDVLYYAIRPGDVYLPFLLKYGFLKKDQVVGMGKYMPED